MRKIYRNFITEKEAQDLISDKDILHNACSFSSGAGKDIMSRVITEIENDFNFTIKSTSYYRTEQFAQGHVWHMDNEAPGNCEVAGSILLRDCETGGDTYYADDSNGKNQIKSDRNIYDLIVHNSDVWHKVEPNSGERIVLVFFI